MIIFGTRIRHKVIGEGKFFCPKCQTTRAYQHKKAGRYFALYFVPLVPMGQAGEYVECQTCHTAFEPSILQQKRTPALHSGQTPLALLLNTLPIRLQNGTPAEYLVRDLTAAGLEHEAARIVLEGALKEGSQHCETCGLTYAPSVKYCAECGQPL